MGRILDARAFLNTLGIVFDEQWIDDINKHPLLNEMSAFAAKSVCDRLVEELDIEQLRNYYRVFSPQFCGQTQYKLNGAHPLSIHHTVNVPAFDDSQVNGGHGGHVLIECASDIIISAKGAINAV